MKNSPPTPLLSALLVTVGIGISTAILGTPVPARADETPAAAPEPITREALVDDMHDYFRKEKRGGAVLMGIGAPAVALGGGLLAQDRPLFRGFAYPVLIIGAVELAGGLLFYLRTDAQVRKLEAGFRSSPVETQTAERRRMRRVNLQFALIEGFELTLLLGGVAMAVAGGALSPQTLSIDNKETLIGVGLGIALESAGLLTFDLFASRRAHAFTRSLERVLISASPTMAPSAGGGTALLGGAQMLVSGAF